MLAVAADCRPGLDSSIGRELMLNLADEARSRGVEQLSLSVELKNLAMALCSSVGFVVVDEAEGAATMLLDLA